MENIEYSKSLLSFVDKIIASSAAKAKKSDLLQIIKNHESLLDGISAVYAYVDLINREVPNLKVINRKNGEIEISLGITDEHINLSKNYLKTEKIPEETKTKELYLDTKQDSRAERIEFILGK